MIHTDTRGSLDERNPAFFGRFPQKHIVVVLSILTCSGMMGVPLNSPCFWILYYCVTSVLLLCYICVTSELLLWRYFCEYKCVTIGPIVVFF